MTTAPSPRTRAGSASDAPASARPAPATHDRRSHRDPRRGEADEPGLHATPRFGASWRPELDAWDVLLPAPRARSVRVSFFDDGGWARPVLTRALTPVFGPLGRAWWTRVPRRELGGARLYGFRVDGPRPGDPEHDPFDRFDPDKLLLDPWGRGVRLPPTGDRAAACGPGDTLGRAPLSLLVREPWPDEVEGDPLAGDPASPWRPAPLPPRPASELLIYEAHVRGFTRHPASGVPPKRRGTYLGVIDRIPHLVELGVTAIELMPVFAFDPTEPNYWGYMPLGFLAPHAGYATDGRPETALTECRAMVAALHRAGIEVILDVVLNHTGEAGDDGPTTSLRGIDHGAFYLRAEDGRSPADLTGCRNTIDVTRPLARRLVLDCLRWWRGAMGIDGFRFDLAAVLARGDEVDAGGTHRAPLIEDVRRDPWLAGARLIAEPWDAAGTVMLGPAFPGREWMQWNGAYRDTVQRFLAGRPGAAADLATRVHGSSDLFRDAAGKPDGHRRSVNHVVSHDGSTLRDLVSYERRRNHANGHANRDGPDECRWNGGHEGPGAPAAVEAVRARQVRNALVILLCSAGVPMIRMGDEMGQTQGGNTNPYRLDDETTWLDWSRRHADAGLLRFVRRLAACRRSLPAITRPGPWEEDVAWLGPDGPADFSAAARTLGWRVRAGGLPGPDVCVLLNGDDRPHAWRLPEPRPGGWRRLVDTARPSPADVVDPGEAMPLPEPALELGARSSVVLLSGPRAQRPGDAPSRSAGTAERRS